MSSLVIHKAVYPLTIVVYCNTTRSSHPHRLFLFVVTPNSAPLVWSSSPTDWNMKGNSCTGPWNLQYFNTNKHSIEKVYIINICSRKRYQLSVHKYRNSSRRVNLSFTTLSKTHIEQLRRERSVSNSRRIRFHHSNDVADVTRRDPQSGAHASNATIGRSYVWVRAWKRTLTLIG